MLQPFEDQLILVENVGRLLPRRWPHRYRRRCHSRDNRRLRGRVNLQDDQSAGSEVTDLVIKRLRTVSVDAVPETVTAEAVAYVSELLREPTIQPFMSAQ
jgi:hypothetical protein